MQLWLPYTKLVPLFTGALRHISMCLPKCFAELQGRKLKFKAKSESGSSQFSFHMCLSYISNLTTKKPYSQPLS